MKNRPMHIFALAWAAVMIAIVSSTLTLLLAGRGSGQRWVSEKEYERLERYSRLDSVRETLLDQYYQPLSEDDLLLGAIRGMTASVGDIYTFYYTPEEMARENADDAGRYFGIGVQLVRTEEGEIEIQRVYPNTPSEEAGLQRGDHIVTVDGTAVNALTDREYRRAVTLMRGEEDTEVLLGIVRGQESLEIPVARSNISISYAEYTILEDNIGYVSISQFTGDAADRFDEALSYFKGNGVQGMIIDVRNNPGGLLTEVNRIADGILPEGIIVYVQDREGKRTDYYSDAECYDVPLVVLVNSSSASASEILAASVQALNRGTVVGMTTYGKGIVQSMVTFPEDGAGMQFTSSCYYDANGRSINGVGVTPDVELALVGKRVPVEPDPVSDNQLSAAIDLVKAEIEKTDKQ